MHTHVESRGWQGERAELLMWTALPHHLCVISLWTFFNLACLITGTEITGTCELASKHLVWCSTLLQIKLFLSVKTLKARFLGNSLLKIQHFCPAAKQILSLIQGKKTGGSVKKSRYTCWVEIAEWKYSFSYLSHGWAVGVPSAPNFCVSLFFPKMLSGSFGWRRSQLLCVVVSTFFRWRVHLSKAAVSPEMCDSYLLLFKPARSLLGLWQEVKIGLCLDFFLFRNELPLGMPALNKVWFAQACQM